ncbi:MAG: glycosyltransferase family 2 protein [Clostridiales bacterium]|nr:glycosyltransferase family 2 protein [Clostridiales bacterium]
MVKYSIIIPVYNEQEVLDMCYGELKKLAAQFDGDYELIFVNDGSADNSLNMLKEYAKADKTVKVISFSRNFGHQAAVSAGMEHASGQALIILDADLQDPPEVVLQMIEKWREGYDIVYGKRIKRKGERPLKKLTAFLYYRFLARITSLNIPKDTGDFRLLSRKAADAIIGMPEKNRYLRGMNAWVGFRQAEVKYERHPRAAGETKYTLKKMFKLAGDGIISNTNFPLTAMFGFGLFLGFLSLAGFIALIALQIAKIISSPVYWLFPFITLMTGFIMTGLGMLGIYLGRVYDEVKDRPLYIVSEKINL